MIFKISWAAFGCIIDEVVLCSIGDTTNFVSLLYQLQEIKILLWLMSIFQLYSVENESKLRVLRSSKENVKTYEVKDLSPKTPKTEQEEVANLLFTRTTTSHMWKVKHGKILGLYNNKQEESLKILNAVLAFLHAINTYRTSHFMREFICHIWIKFRKQLLN